MNVRSIGKGFQIYVLYKHINCDVNMKIAKPLSPKLKTVGRRLRKNRKSKNYSQKKLADELKMDHATISKYENGLIDIPVSVLIRVCEKCGFEPKSCFGWSGDGLDELQKLLEDCIKEPELRITEGSDNRVKIKLSDKSKDLLMSYIVFKTNPDISEKTLNLIKEDIISSIEREQGAERNDLYKRLVVYSKNIKKISKKK